MKLKASVMCPKLITMFRKAPLKDMVMEYNWVITLYIICSVFLVLVRNLAAAFCMSCNCLMVFFWKASEKSIAVIYTAGND